jgi:hypothetical protein
MPIPRPNPWKNVPYVGPLIDDIQNSLDPGQAVQLADVVMLDVLSARPAAGTEGRLFYASDAQSFWRDNGATWDELVPKPPIALIVALGG